mmetsp:Transcript_9050/g.10464  ORF Transcript_9050/g.10464 Transcript_9050/m.10464 type:complete len:298 (+) Transcript_9050:2-895(+)
MDMLGDLMDAPATTAPPAATASAADPFAAMEGMDLLGGAAPTADAGTIQPIGSIKEWYTKLCTTDTGVLYQDVNLQIGLKASYQGPAGRVILYFANKSQNALDRVTVHVAPIQGLRLNMGPPVPATFPVGANATLQIDVGCVQPYMEPPALQFSYSSNGQQLQQTVTLPIVLTKFLVPWQVTDRNMFFGRWNAIAGPPLKLQEVLHVSSHLAQHGSPAITGLFNSLKLNVIPGLDPNAANIVTAANLATEGGAETLCIVRLEAAPNDRSQFRVTVATANQVSTSCLKDLVVSHLKGN